MDELNDNERKGDCDPMEDPYCCLCGGELELAPSGDYYMGNNPDPVMDPDEGQCCSACNTFVVVPARSRESA